MVGGVHSPYTFNIVNYEKANSQFNFGKCVEPTKSFMIKEPLLGVVLPLKSPLKY